MNALQTEWARLSHDLGVEPGYAARVWAHLVAAYGEPQRRYHTLDHIKAVVADWKRVRGCFEKPDPVLLALFFHDVVYDPAMRDNEERSADVLDTGLRGHVAPEVLAFARTAIVATASHAGHGDADIDLLLDIDKAILGAPRDVYLRYAEDVAREYLPVHGFDAYAAGRAGLFLEPSLGRGALFLTESFAALEDQARANLAEELALWRSGAFADRLRSGL
jgi:predicted metal-dependent HD superfamily phosphohydrolase